jgi:hypothetical protein
MSSLIDSFLNQARPELDRLSKSLSRNFSEGRLSEAKADADRIAEITTWAAKVEEIQRNLSLLKPPPPPPTPPAAVATRARALSPSGSPESGPPAASGPLSPAAPLLEGDQAGGAAASAGVLQPPGQTPEVSTPRFPPPVPLRAGMGLPPVEEDRGSRRPPILPPDNRDEEKLRQRRRSLESDVRDFLERSRDMLGITELNLEEEAMAKAVIIKGRALEAEANDIKSHLRLSIKEEVLLLGEWWDRTAANREFFGLNMVRTHPPEIWREVAEAYEILAAAEEATAWLESSPGLTDTQLASILEMAACAEAYLLRVFDDRAMNVWDGQQKTVHSRLESFEPGPSITKWWRRTDPPPAEELKKKGLALRGEVAALRKAKERAQATQQALTQLKDYVTSAVGSEFNEEGLVSLAEQAMDAGVPPSHRELRTLLAGYRAPLETSTHRDVQKLVQYLNKDALDLIAKRKAAFEVVVEEDPTDADLAAKTSDLIPITEGKTLLFVGGSKGQGWRKDEYIRALNLKEVIWPDAEEGTKVTDLAGKVGKADIVCLLIRFSRHSYKAVLDEAKAQGKLTVTLPRGYGVNTLIHEMWTQLEITPSSPPHES